MHQLNSLPPVSDMITVREAARRSGWTAGHIRSLAQCGKLESNRSEGRILVDAECLAILLRARAACRPKPKLRLVVSNNHL
ncbi:hypothetical protein ACQKP1_02490 [Allorhizobium sp. NPDC080224]|uniref:hypothetical protein n=1 Tax=Allorhizobium sp. NPDC080224 TaxID=3390547 RepID=UPI003D03AD16